MEDTSQNPAISAPTENLWQWLSAYLQTRAHLAQAHSDFHCDPACQRPGCKNLDLQVPVSLIDLVAAARHRGESVWAHYQRHYSLGLFSDERDDWLRRVSLRLKKPCAFLIYDLCSIYPVRPLACMLFPEYLAAEDAVAANAAKAHFREYLCLQRPLLISPARRGVVAKLKSLWEREKLISSFYLFKDGSCHLDFGNLTKELLAEAGNAEGAGLSGEPALPQIIPNHIMERYFDKHLALHPPFAWVREKIAQLENPEAMGQLRQWLEDDRLVRQLKQNGDGRVTVFRFVKGRLKPTRRSLMPSVYAY